MGDIGNNVKFYFVDFAMNKPGRIDASGTLTINWEPVVPNCSPFSSLFVTSSRSGVFVLSFILLII